MWWFIERASCVGIAAALTLVVACDSQTVDPGNGTTSATSTGAGGAGGAAVAAVDVTLQYKTSSVLVNLAALPTTTFKATTVVKLTDVWAAGGLKDDISMVTFDFEGDDGFHPSGKPACKNNITAAQLAQGFITPDTRALLWPDALGFSGCYFVKQLKIMTAVDPSGV